MPTGIICISRCHQQHRRGHGSPTVQTAAGTFPIHIAHHGSSRRIAVLGPGTGTAARHGCQPLVLQPLGHLADDDAQGIDVGPQVQRLSGLQSLGCQVIACAGRQLQGVVVVAVGQSEVYQLDVVSVVGHQNVFGLEVAVYNLLAMQVAQGTAQFAHEFTRQFRRQFSLFHEFPQGLPVDVLHHDAVAQLGQRLPPQGAAHVRMLQLVADVELLAQGLFVERIAYTGRLESLEHVQAVVPTATEQPAIARGRHIDFLQVGEARPACLAVYINETR